MMKRTALALGAVLVLSQIALAQSQMWAGPVFGANINTHTGAGLPKKVTGYGIVVGGQSDVLFNKSLGLRLSLTYDNRVGSYSEQGTDPTSKLDYSLDKTVTVAYVTFEPLFRYTVPNYTLFLVVGPSVSFNAGSKTEETTTITTPGYSFSSGYASESTVADIRNMNIRFELKVGIGSFFEFDKRTRLSFQFTYGYGLTDIEKNVDWKLRTLSLRGSLDLGFGN